MDTVEKVTFPSEEFFICGYKKLEDLIERVYGKKYDIPVGEKVGNDAYLVPHIRKRNDLGQYDINLLTDFIKNGHIRSEGYGVYLLDLLMQDMCNKGIIPEGKYVIDVCW